MTKKVVTMSDGSEKLVTENAEHIVILRPKAYVPSSGSTWARETHRLRCEYPDTHEVPPENPSVKYLSQFCQFCARVHGDVYLLADMTMQDDLEKMTSSRRCDYRDYELKRLAHFVKRMEINCVTVDLKRAEMSTAEIENVEIIKESLIPLTNNCNKIIQQFESGK